VTSIDALKDFREAMCSFCQAARDAICAVQIESGRVVDWVVYDRPRYWERQLRERQEEVAQAQQDLFRVRLTGGKDRHPDDIEQRKALARAKQRVEEAEEKIKLVKKWRHVAQRAVDDFGGRVQRLSELVEGDPPPPVIFLDRALDSLESYLAVAPPVVERASAAGAASVARPLAPSAVTSAPNAAPTPAEPPSTADEPAATPGQPAVVAPPPSEAQP
jgi:hypothetical protein